MRYNNVMKKFAIVVYGSPGAGKGTQANLLAKQLGLIHVDTGRFLESIVHDPARQHEVIIRRERKFFDTGKLMTPSFVTGEVLREMKKVHSAGFGVIFSGFPRTMEEAEKFYPLAAKLYGKKNVKAFVLETSAANAGRRNGARRICATCGYDLLTKFYPVKNPKHCPVCGGRFYTRTLDKPAVIKVRLKEYRERTEPVFHFVTQHGYFLRKIDGAPAPYKVFGKILSLIA